MLDLLKRVQSPFLAIPLAFFVLVLLIAALAPLCRRFFRLRLSEIRMIGLTLKFDPVAPERGRILKKVREDLLSPADNSVPLRIDRSLLKTHLQTRPHDVEAHTLLVKVEDALRRTPPFVVRLDRHVQQLGLAATAALWLVFAFLELALHGVTEFTACLCSYPLAALFAWSVTTVVHEDGHFRAVRQVIRRRHGTVIPRLWLFRFTNWGTTFTIGGLLKLVFALRARDVVLDVDQMVETAVADAARLRGATGEMA